MHLKKCDSSTLKELLRSFRQIDFERISTFNSTLNMSSAAPVAAPAAADHKKNNKDGKEAKEKKKPVRHPQTPTIDTQRQSIRQRTYTCNFTLTCPFGHVITNDEKGRAILRSAPTCPHCDRQDPTPLGSRLTVIIPPKRISEKKDAKDAKDGKKDEKRVPTPRLPIVFEHLAMFPVLVQEVKTYILGETTADAKKDKEARLERAAWVNAVKFANRLIWNAIVIADWKTVVHQALNLEHRELLQEMEAKKILDVKFTKQRDPNAPPKPKGEKKDNKRKKPAGEDGAAAPKGKKQKKAADEKKA